MIFEFKNRSSVIKFVLVFFVLLLMVAGLVWLYSSNAKKQQVQFHQDLQNLRQNYFSGDLLNTTSDFVKKLEALDKEKLNRSPDDEAMLQLYLGAGYLLSRTNDGISILKGLAENKKNTDFVRGQSLLMLARYYDFYPDENIAKQQILTDTFFSQFTKDNPDNIPKAFKNLDEYANQMSPDPYASYRVARWYSGELLNNSNLSPSEKDNYFSKTNENLKKGDELVKSSSRFSPQGPLILLYKALVLQNLYLANKSDAGLEDIEMPYKQLLVLNKADKAREHSDMFTAFARFYYAAFLARVNKDGRADDIKNILAPLYDVTIRSYLVFDFLKMARNDNGNPYHADIGNLSAIDPKFKTLMNQL